MSESRPNVRIEPPPKPVLLFDGECALCAAWVTQAQRRSGGRMECVSYQDPSVTVRFPKLARERLEQSAHFVDVDGSVHCGIRAILRVPGGGHAQAWLLRLCDRMPGIAWIAERLYRLVADNRGWIGLKPWRRRWPARRP